MQSKKHFVFLIADNTWDAPRRRGNLGKPPRRQAWDNQPPATLQLQGTIARYKGKNTRYNTMVNNNTIKAICESIAIFPVNQEWQAACELARLYDSMTRQGIASQFGKIKKLILARLEQEYNIKINL